VGHGVGKAQKHRAEQCSYLGENADIWVLDKDFVFHTVFIRLENTVDNNLFTPDP
jgi:hypothetical protein